MSFEAIELNKYGVNASIGYRILSDEKMREHGFTDRRPDKWYYMKHVSDDHETSFNVLIDKDGIDDVRIDVLDEQFCQPYDYQHILSKTPNHPYALAVMVAVEKEMQYLQDAGILFGHKHGEYI